MRCGVVCLKLLAGEIEATMRTIPEPVGRSREAFPLGQDGEMVTRGTVTDAGFARTLASVEQRLSGERRRA